MEDEKQAATPRRKYDQLAALRACREENHRPIRPGVKDATGVEHTKCRVCGCGLSRMPVLRRWFRTGQMG